MNNKNRFRAFMGYLTGDSNDDPAIYTDSADFKTIEEASDWVSTMYNAGCDFDTSSIEEITDESDLVQIEAWEEQEMTRLEIGVPKNLF